MDKNDDFIKNKAIEESETFNLPQSFEDKIESVLENIEYKKTVDNNLWYRNKKFLVIAASFVFVCFVLIRLADKNDYDYMSADEAPKSSAIMESTKDDTFQIYSEEDGGLRDEQSYSGEEESISNITLSLNFDNNEVEGIQGQVIYEDDDSFDNRILESQTVQSIQRFEVNESEIIYMNFTNTPNSYRVNLLREGLKQDINEGQIEVEEYPSQDFILKSPDSTGIYTFEIIGNWYDKEIKYTISIQVNDN